MNKFQPASKLTLPSSLLPALLIPFLFVQTAFAAGFSDVPQTHENYIAITYLNTENIISGYEDGTFRPAQTVNRAEALKILLVGNNAVIQDPAASQEVAADGATTQVIAPASFSDVSPADWFAKYVGTAKSLGIVAGNPDGSFAPGRTVTRSEFIKMLLNMNGFNTEKWLNQQLFADVPADAWYAPYMNYAGQAGLIIKDENNNLSPGKELTRGEVAEIFYLMAVIRQGKDTQFLLNQAEAQMAQIEIFVAAADAASAKRAAELSVDMTQQAYKNLPDNNIVLGAAKLARAYDFLVNSFVSAVQKDNTAATDWANQAIAKATEAWEANNELQPVCKHIKDRANEILAQLAKA